jgi:hypothetical protein
MNIIELAQECRLIGMRPHLDGIYQEALEKFAKLVAAHEREACAAMFDNRNVWDEEVGERIRARGTT